MRFPTLLIGFFVTTLASVAVPAEQPTSPRPIPADQFDKLCKMIKPQKGETLFMEIPWELSLWEGRQKAAKEGKPMLVWAGGWGVPIGSC
jgi:hypothetical protein